jgi:hypothetical protein
LCAPPLTPGEGEWFADVLLVGAEHKWILIIIAL